MAAAAAAQPVAPPAGAAFDALHYAVRLDPDVSAGTLKGREALAVRIGTYGVGVPASTLTFDCGELTIDTVHENGAVVPFAREGRRLVLRLQRPARPNERRRFDIEYHGAPRFGLTLLGDRAQAYTTFSTSQWMVAVDTPADRATLDLSVAVPAEWAAAGSGREVSRRRQPDGTTLYRWRQDRPVPSYTFGFVAGRFSEATARHGGVRLRYMGAGFSGDELRRVFRDTGAMLAFFEDRAGVRYPSDAYAQALVATSGGQELAGLAHMAEAYGRVVLDDSTATSLIAHEIAHQWWGNSIACRDWTHFWLNEGMATFMAAAFRERQLGREAYLVTVNAWRERLTQLRAAGHDKPLVFPDWDRPTADDRAVVYQKGALVLHELRETLGDTVFWTALRAYTREHVGHSVTTADFQAALEKASGRRLDGFFDEWVYLTARGLTTQAPSGR